MKSTSGVAGGGAQGVGEGDIRTHTGDILRGVMDKSLVLIMVIVAGRTSKLIKLFTLKVYKYPIIMLYT